MYIAAAIFGWGEYCIAFLKRKQVTAIPKINMTNQKISAAVITDQMLPLALLKLEISDMANFTKTR
ncbi:hypothetical protein D3C87_2208940 [compost metagenome]